MLSVDKKQLEALLVGVGAKKSGAMDALSRWIEDQPGYDFQRTRLMGELVKEPRFAAARAEVEVFGQLLDLGSPQLKTSESATAALKAWFARHPNEAPARAKQLLDLAAKTPPKRREWRTPALLCLPLVKVVPAAYEGLVAQLCSVHLDEDQEKVVLAALKKMPVSSRDECVAVAVANGAVHRVTPGMLALASPKLRAQVQGKPVKAKAAPAKAKPKAPAKAKPKAPAKAKPKAPAKAKARAKR